MIKIRCRGTYDKTEKFLKEGKDINELRQIMERYGREGVAALSANTPIDTGLTASSWSFEVIQDSDGISLVFNNSNTTKTGIPIAILLQYGHGNGKGGYVQGRDFINPAIQPIFDRLATEAWKEVTT
jgi:hypothetical protein